MPLVARNDRAVLGHAVRAALAIAADRHGGGAPSVLRLADVGGLGVACAKQDGRCEKGGGVAGALHGIAFRISVAGLLWHGAARGHNLRGAWN